MLRAPIFRCFGTEQSPRDDSWIDSDESVRHISTNFATRHSRLVCPHRSQWHTASMCDCSQHRFCTAKARHVYPFQKVLHILLAQNCHFSSDKFFYQTSSTAPLPTQDAPLNFTLKSLCSPFSSAKEWPPVTSTLNHHAPQSCHPARLPSRAHVKATRIPSAIISAIHKTLDGSATNNAHAAHLRQLRSKGVWPVQLCHLGYYEISHSWWRRLNASLCRYVLHRERSSTDSLLVSRKIRL